MKRILLALALAPALVGCEKAPETEAKPSPPATAAKQPAPPKTSQQDQGVTPMGGVGAGPMAPVAGTESVQGGGSGVGDVLKRKAKNAAARESQSGSDETGQ